MNSLTDIRNQIDLIDEQIVKLYLERVSLCSQIAEYKKNNNIAIENKLREQQIIDRLTNGLEIDKSQLVKSLYEKIFSLSKDYQKDLLEENK